MCRQADGSRRDHNELTLCQDPEVPPAGRQAVGGYAVKPSTVSSRLATGSTARKRLSRATAPSRGGPAGLMKQGVVTSCPFRVSRTSATGHTYAEQARRWVMGIVPLRRSAVCPTRGSSMGPIGPPRGDRYIHKGA